VQPGLVAAAFDYWYPLGADRTVVALSRAAPIVLDGEWMRILRACRGFKSVSEHQAEIERSHPPHPDRPSHLFLALNGLVGLGAMVSLESLLHSGRPEPEKSPSIHTLVVPTCDHPELLERCIRSFAANATRFARPMEFVVADDARSVEARARTRECLGRLVRTERLAIRYGGFDEKRTFAEAVHRRSGVPLETVEFALLGHPSARETMGANRNALMLDTLGGCVLSADDDTVCDTSMHPDSRDGVVFLDDVDPSEVWFYSSRQAAVAAAKPVSVDFFGAHERLLGHRLGDVVREPLASLAEAGHYLPRLLARDGGRVAVTYNSVVGDSGMYSGMNLLGATGSTRARLVRSEAEYRSAFTSREVARITAVSAVRRGPPSNGMFLGLDNRHPLPPFFPVCRNEDGVFGRALDMCFPDLCFGHAPVAALHAPPEGRVYRQGATGQVRLSDVVLTTMRTCLPSGAVLASGNWKAILQMTGGQMAHVASSPRDVFACFVRDRLCAQASSLVGHYEWLIQQHGGLPTFWVADLRSRIETLRAALTRDDYYVPVDLEEDVASQTLERTQQLIKAWGELLLSWPAIVETASLLKARGLRITTAL
jgi:hypothetical protein